MTPKVFHCVQSRVSPNGTVRKLGHFRVNLKSTHPFKLPPVLVYKVVINSSPAPELLKGEPVTVATDMWSLGVLLYTLLGGVSPFLVDSLDLTKDNICSGRYSFPGKHFKTVSERGRDIIAGLLVGDQRLVPVYTWHCSTTSLL